MKYIERLVLLMLSCALVVPTVNADIIMTNSQELVTVTAQITNLSDYPEVSVVGCETMINIGRVVKDRVSSLGPMTLYLVKKKYLKKVDVNKHDWQKDKHAQKMNLFYEKGVLESSDYSSISVDYKLAKKGSTYYVYKSKVTYKLRSKGEKKAPADVVKTFEDNVINPSEPIYVYENLL